MNHFKEGGGDVKRRRVGGSTTGEKQTISWKEQLSLIQATLSSDAGGRRKEAHCSGPLVRPLFERLRRIKMLRPERSTGLILSTTT